MDINTDTLRQDVCRGIFYQFVKEFWHVIIPDTPTWNWHIEYLCHEIQVVMERVFAGQEKEHDLLVNISPGSTKSTIVSIMLPAWAWTRMPALQYIGGSYADELSLTFSRKTRNIIRSEKYQRLFGITLKKDQDTKTYFENTELGGRRATSTGANITGNHAHVIVIDDPINPKGARSEVELKTARNWMSETLLTRKVSAARTPVIMIMQRLHEADPSGEWIHQAKMGKKRVRHVCLPAEVTEHIRPRHLKRKYVDGVMDPYRLPRTVLDEFKGEMGDYGYAGQFLQSPVPLGGGMFKVGQIELVDEAPNMNHFELVRYWDKAGTEGGGAYSAGVLIGKHKPSGVFWILDVVRGQWGAHEREANIKQTAELDPKHVRIWLEQEPGSGGKESAESTVKNLSGYSVSIERPTGDKATRAYPLAAQTNVGNVKCLIRPWTQAFIDELKFFPASRYKDQVDAGGGGFNKLNGKKKTAGALFS